jgi:hypothetical protein
MTRERNGWISGLLVVALATTPIAAGEGTLEKSAVELQMESQGWNQVTSNVFERKLGAGKVEHLGYGREGLAWTIGEMHRQLDRLLAEFELFPTIELAETLEGLAAAISKARGELGGQSREDGGLTAAPLALDGPSCDGVCYSATADAYHQTSQQGVGATAMAKFNNPCGYTGETYAYAYARATAGTTTTQVTQEDPKTGTSITSSVVASVAGGSGSLPCFSTAASFVQSSLLGFSYSTSDTNDGYCPVPVGPPSCSISGTNYEYFAVANCRSRTWSAVASGGAAPYSYQWKLNGTVVGTGASYTRSVCATGGDFTVALTVTGANGQSCTSSVYVVVDYYPEPTCGQYLC